MLYSICLKAKKIVALILLITAFIWGLCALRPREVPASSYTDFDVPIIMYHSVCSNSELACDYVVSTNAFRKDMEYLKANGYTSIFISDLMSWVKGEYTLPNKPIIITFDDGFLNYRTEALPILEELNMKAVVSIVGEYTDKYTDNGDRNPAYAYLSWEDIEKLAASGRVEIGNHTNNMHSLSGRRGCTKKPQENDDEYRALLKADLISLQNKLAANANVTPKVFAYPYGFVSKASISVLKDTGFEAALLCEEKVNHLTGDPEELYCLGRFNRAAKYTTEQFMSRLVEEQ